MIRLRRKLQHSLEMTAAARCSRGVGGQQTTSSQVCQQVCGQGRDEKRLTLHLCKINALKEEAPNALRSAYCIYAFAQRGYWKCTSLNWDISNSAAS